MLGLPVHYSPTPQLCTWLEMPSMGLALFFKCLSRMAASHSGLLKVCGNVGPTERRRGEEEGGGIVVEG